MEETLSYIDDKTGKRVVAKIPLTGDKLAQATAPEVPVDYNVIDQETLNRALTESGSVLRALAELLLERDTAMTEAVASATSLASLKADFPKPVTRQQFVQALKAKMRG